MTVADQAQQLSNGANSRHQLYLQPSLRSHSDDPNVILLSWPKDQARRCELELRGIPRLLVVTHGVQLPKSVDPLEDWIRPPVEREELIARIRQLQARATARTTPVIDEFGVLRFANQWLSLSTLESRLMRALTSSMNGCVGRDALTRLAWPNKEDVTHNALNLHVLRLRRRIRPLGLEIRTVRRFGYLLEVTSRLESEP